MVIFNVLRRVDSLGKHLKVVVALGICACVLGCGHVVTVQPTLPAPPGLPPAPISVVSVSVKASIASVGPLLDDAIPSAYDSGTYCTAFGLLCASGSIEREPVRLTLHDNLVQLDAGLNYEVDVNVAGIACSCGRPDNPKRRANASFSGRLNWTPDWALSLDGATASVTPVDACKVCVFNRDITPDVMRLMSKVTEALPAAANTRLGAVTDMRKQAGAVWEALQRPIQQDGVWIDVHPVDFVVSPVSGVGEIVGASAALQLRAEVGRSKPPDRPLEPLPKLRVGAPNGDFHIAPQISIPIGTVRDALASQIEGRVFVYDPLPAIKVTAERVRLLASGETVVVGVDIGGAVRGTLWLKGTVGYDPVARRLTFLAVDYDVQTKNALVAVAAWLAPKLLDDAVHPAIKAYAYDVGKELDLLKSQLDLALNRPISPNARLDTQLDKIEIAGPYSDATNFVFSFNLSGHSQVVVAPASQPLPSGKEIRLVGVSFQTSDDDKDAEEDVFVWVDYGNVGGHPLSGRRLGHLERWGDGESQGPYYFRLNGQPEVSNCRDISLHVYKAPVGSDTGKGWHMSMKAMRILGDGSTKAATHSGNDAWGDGHPFDRRFYPLCDEP